MSNAEQQGGSVSRRRAHTDARLSEAVREQLGAHGYQALTIEGVSRQSGVAKTTIYRRWQSKAEWCSIWSFTAVMKKGSPTPAL